MSTLLSNVVYVNCQTFAFRVQAFDFRGALSRGDLSLGGKIIELLLYPPPSSTSPCFRSAVVGCDPNLSSVTRCQRLPGQFHRTQSDLVISFLKVHDPCLRIASEIGCRSLPQHHCMYPTPLLHFNPMLGAWCTALMLSVYILLCILASFLHESQGKEESKPWLC